MMILILLLLFSPLQVNSFRWINRGEFFEDGGCRFTGEILRSEVSNKCGASCKSNPQCTHYTFYPTTKTCELRKGWKAGEGPIGAAAGQVNCGCVIGRMPNIRSGCVPEVSYSAVEPPFVPDTVLAPQITTAIPSTSTIAPDSTTNVTFWEKVVEMGRSLNTTVLILLLNLPLFLSIAFACFCLCRKIKTRQAVAFATDLKYIQDLHDNVDQLEYDKTYEISQGNLEQGERIGNGFYADVSLGVFHISKQWKMNSKLFNRLSTINVAVKTACTTQTVDHNELSESMLIDELKIYCAVGKHPNVVTLLGAITTEYEHP